MENYLTDENIDNALLSELLGSDDSSCQDDSYISDFRTDIQKLSTEDEESAIFCFPEDFSVCSVQAILKCHDIPCDMSAVMKTLWAWEVPISDDFRAQAELYSEYTVADCLWRATKGDADACFILGMLLNTWTRSLFLIAAIWRDSMFLIRTASEMTHHEALHFVAQVELDNMLSANRPRATRACLDILRKAELTQSIENFSLITKLWDGRYIPESIQANIRQLQLFAESGFAPAIHELASEVYLNCSERSSLYWLRRSAELGNQRSIGLLKLHEAPLRPRGACEAVKISDLETTVHSPLPFSESVFIQNAEKEGQHDRVPSQEGEELPVEGERGDTQGDFTSSAKSLRANNREFKVEEDVPMSSPHKEDQPAGMLRKTLHAIYRTITFRKSR